MRAGCGRRARSGGPSAARGSSDPAVEAKDALVRPWVSPIGNDPAITPRDRPGDEWTWAGCALSVLPGFEARAIARGSGEGSWRWTGSISWGGGR